MHSEHNVFIFILYNYLDTFKLSSETSKAIKIGQTEHKFKTSGSTEKNETWFATYSVPAMSNRNIT